MKKRLFRRIANNVRSIFEQDDFISVEELRDVLKEDIKRYSLDHEGVNYHMHVGRSKIHGEYSTLSTVTGIKLPQYPGNFQASQFISDFIERVDGFYRISGSYTLNREGFFEPGEEGKGSVKFEVHKSYMFPSFSSGNCDTEAESIARCNRRTRRHIEVYNEHRPHIERVLDIVSRDYPQTEGEVAEIIRRLRLPFTLIGNYPHSDPFAHVIYGERTPPLGGIAYYPKWVLMEVAALGDPRKEEAVRDELSKIRRETGDLPREETPREYKFTSEGLCAIN